MSYVFSVGTGSLPEVTVWKGNVYACVWLLPFMTLLSTAAVYAARQQFHHVLNPSLPPPSVASSSTAEWPPPSSACRAVRDTPNEVREPIQLEEVESFQDGRSSGRGAEELRPLWWQVASQFIIKPSYPVQALRRSSTPIHLNPSSSSFGHHSPSPGVYSSVQNCVSKGAGIWVTQPALHEQYGEPQECFTGTEDACVTWWESFLKK